MKKLLLTAAVAPLVLFSSKLAFAEPQAAEEAATEIRDGEQNTNESIFSRHCSYRVVYGAPYYYSPCYGHYYRPYAYAHRHGRFYNWFHRHHRSTKVKVKVKNHRHHGHHHHSAPSSTSTTVRF